MKDEDLAFKAVVLYGIANSVNEFEDAEESMKDLLRELVARAYDEAMQMACGWCLNGEPVRPVGDGDYLHKVYDKEFPCSAAGIRALKARLDTPTQDAQNISA
jgi:hypothetical protein